MTQSSFSLSSAIGVEDNLVDPPRVRPGKESALLGQNARRHLAIGLEKGDFCGLISSFKSDPRFERAKRHSGRMVSYRGSCETAGEKVAVTRHWFKSFTSWRSERLPQG